jgi:N-methylhydantoinase B
VSEIEIHPLVLAVVAGALESITREMSDTVERTARTPLLRLGHDYSNAIFDASGRLVASSERDLPNHVGSMGFAGRAVLEFAGIPDEGDIWYHNDPANGGSHLPDMTLFRPVYHEGEFVFLVGCKAHMLDVGGMTAGGYHPQATEICQEGIRIPPLKLGDANGMRSDVLNLLKANVRYPDLFEGDLMAQAAAASVAAGRLSALLERYGLATITGCVEELLSITDVRMREFVDSIPDGSYEGRSMIENDGRCSGPLEIRARVEITGDQATVRLVAPPQVQSYINCYAPNSYSMAYLAFLAYAGLQPPINQGAYAAVTVDCGPPGTIVNAQLPAPSSMSTSIANQHTLEAVLTALAQALPDRAHAGWSMVPLTIISGVHPASNERYTGHFLLTVMGGAGATARADGWSTLGPASSAGGIRAGSVEDVEAEYPVLVRRCEWRIDSGGAGRRRGGLGMAFEFTPIDHTIEVVATGVGDTYPAASVAGAESRLLEPKLNRRYVVTRSGEHRRVYAYAIETAESGEVVCCHPQGGGGVGSPWERPVFEVTQDVRNGLVSSDGARLDYGVAIDPATLVVDQDETSDLRSRAMRDGADYSTAVSARPAR